MINTEEVEIIPDSLELEIAYWETFRSEWPMEQYKAGRKLLHIAKEHNRSTESLRRFFDRRYGTGWKRSRGVDQRGGARRIVIRNEQIVALLAEGWRTKEIAAVMGVSYDSIRLRISGYKLREVAANDSYKPSYAA